MRPFALVAAVALFGCGPTARPTADPGEREKNIKVGEETTFDGSASLGAIDVYEWDFGDGSPVEFGKVVKHKYKYDGYYTARLTVHAGGYIHAAAIVVNVGAGCVAVAGLAVLTMSPQQNVPVRFASTGSKGCDGSALVKYAWDFGDGVTDTGDAAKATVEHTFAQKGTFTITLTVTDTKGHEGTATRSLGVGVVSGKPTVVCPAAVNATVGKLVTLNATATDPGGMTVSFEWDYGDGSMKGIGALVQHAYATPGMKTATVVATTADLRVSDPCSTTVVVAAPPDYSGSWLLNPASTNLSGCQDFTVGFPAATLTTVHAQSTDGGTATLTATPMGGSWPAGNSLTGSEDAPPAAPGTFRLRKTLPNETRGACGVVTREESVEATFTSPMAVMGTWKMVFTATSCLGSGTGCVPATCNCIAQVGYSGVKQ